MERCGLVIVWMSCLVECVASWSMCQSNLVHVAHLLAAQVQEGSQ